MTMLMDVGDDDADTDTNPEDDVGEEGEELMRMIRWNTVHMTMMNE